MPKQGWKWRTEKFRRMSSDELWEACTWNRPEFQQITPKLARWIFNHLVPTYQPDEDHRWQATRIRLLWVIASHPHNPPWKVGFFWRVIGETKSLPICWDLVEVMSGFVGGLNDAPRFIALYDDPTAHPLARGEAIFALGYLQNSSEPGWNEATHDVCLRAFRDAELPYARAGACCLATFSCRFKNEIAALLDDPTPVFGNWASVGSYAADYYDQFLHQGDVPPPHVCACFGG